jgi:hypothetical protein
MIRKLCVGVSLGLILLMTGCTTMTFADWKSMPPLRASGGDADG